MAKKKSIMQSLGLKKSPLNRKIKYNLPDNVFEEIESWNQVIKLLFQENISNGTLRKLGYVDLDEAFLKSKLEQVIGIRKAFPDIKTPFCTRKAHLAQIEIENGILRARDEDKFLDDLENIMLYVLTFKNDKFLPEELQKQINNLIREKKKPLSFAEKDKIMNDYLDDPEKYLPTLPVFCKAIPEVFNRMYGAALEIINSAKNEDGEKIYDLERKSFRISNDDLVVVLVGSNIWGKKDGFKQMILDQVVYFTGEEEDGEE